MNSSLLPFLAGLAVVFFFLWLARRRDPDDEAAGIAIGPDSQLSTPQPSTTAWPARHFISACMYCHHVTVVHGGPAHVRTGDELRVSHGICDRCMAERHPEVAAVGIQHSAASLNPA